MLESKNTDSSHARHKTKAGGQLVGNADYMVANLEMNGNHTIIFFQTCRQDI